MSRIPLFVLLLCCCALIAPGWSQAAGSHRPDPAWPARDGHAAQYSHFPVPLDQYPAVAGGLPATFKARVARDPFNLAATVIFLVAIAHTFAAGRFTRWAHRIEHAHRERLARQGQGPGHHHPGSAEEVSFPAIALHFLGEVEAIFGIYVVALAAAATWFHSWHDFALYLNFDRNYTEPIFVVVVMAIASSRPILRLAEAVVAKVAALGRGSPGAWWFSILTVTPVLGSFITEPAAITIGALLLAKHFYRRKPRTVLAYATLGLLFVNISIGGTLTHFAAPPVLMVAGPWGWDTPFMLGHFGWKAVLALLAGNCLYWTVFRKDFVRMADAADGREDGVVHPESWTTRERPVPWAVTLCHLLFLGWTVVHAHEPVLFMGGFLFFMAFFLATAHHQTNLQLRGPIMVGFFLAGLIVHGGCQAWWIEPVILALPPRALMLGATILTAFNDNAAITYLAAQVPGISEAAKHAVVAGAVTGGGLTVIANAPNPAGQSLLARFFPGGISPLGLALGALAPTVITYAAFVLLPLLG